MNNNDSLQNKARYHLTLIILLGIIVGGRWANPTDVKSESVPPGVVVTSADIENAARAKAVSQAAEEEPEEQKMQTEKEHTVPSTTPAGQRPNEGVDFNLLLNNLRIQQLIKQQQHKACMKELPPDQRFHCFETPSATFDPSAKVYEQNRLERKVEELEREIDALRNQRDQLRRERERAEQEREQAEGAMGWWFLHRQGQQ